MTWPARAMPTWLGLYHRRQTPIRPFPGSRQCRQGADAGDGPAERLADRMVADPHGARSNVMQPRRTRASRVLSLADNCPRACPFCGGLERAYDDAQSASGFFTGDLSAGANGLLNDMVSVWATYQFISPVDVSWVSIGCRRTSNRYRRTGPIFSASNDIDRAKLPDRGLRCSRSSIGPHESLAADFSSGTGLDPPGGRSAKFCAGLSSRNPC